MKTLFLAMQGAIAIMGIYVLYAWLPAARMIARDLRGARRTARMAVPVWHLAVGAIGGFGAAAMGSIPFFVDGPVPLHGAPWYLGAAVVAAQVSLYMLLLWLASFGAAAARAIRRREPHPWEAEAWLDWPFLRRLSVIIFATSYATVLVSHWAAP